MTIVNPRHSEQGLKIHPASSEWGGMWLAVTTCTHTTSLPAFQNQVVLESAGRATRPPKNQLVAQLPAARVLEAAVLPEHVLVPADCVFRPPDVKSDLRCSFAGRCQERGRYVGDLLDHLTEHAIHSGRACDC